MTQGRITNYLYHQAFFIPKYKILKLNLKFLHFFLYLNDVIKSNFIHLQQFFKLKFNANFITLIINFLNYFQKIPLHNFINYLTKILDCFINYFANILDCFNY